MSTWQIHEENVWIITTGRNTACNTPTISNKPKQTFRPPSLSFCWLLSTLSPRLSATEYHLPLLSYKLQNTWKIQNHRITLKSTHHSCANSEDIICRKNKASRVLFFGTNGLDNDSPPTMETKTKLETTYLLGPVLRIPDNYPSFHPTSSSNRNFSKLLKTAYFYNAVSNVLRLHVKLSWELYLRQKIRVYFMKHFTGLSFFFKAPRIHAAQ